METLAQKINKLDFSRPIEAPFIVALKTKAGTYDLFLEAFLRTNGKGYLRHTANIREAMRYSQSRAEELADELEEFRCTARVERVSPNGLEREVVTREAAVGVLTSPHDLGATADDFII